MDSNRTVHPRRAPRGSKAFSIVLSLALAVGLVGTCALVAASPALAANTAAIEYIAEDAFTPEGYNWSVNFADVKVVSGFTRESNIAQFYPRDYTELARPGDAGFAARIGKSTPKGSFALRYTGATHGSDRVDAVVTLTDWNYVEPIMSDNSSGWDEYFERDEYGTFQPGVFVNLNYQRKGSLLENFNFYTVGLTDLSVSIEFFYAGTNDPYELKGHATCIDLDVGQRFGFGGATTLAQVVANNGFLSIDNDAKLVISPDYACGGVDDPDGAISADPDDPLYKLGLVGAYFDTTGPRRGMPCELSFVTSWHGSDSTAQSFFAMTNEFLTVPNPKDDLADIGKLEVRKTADKTDGVSLGDVVSYTVDTPVHERGVSCRNGYSYTDFEIVDVLPAQMRYVEGSGYLADADGRRIEGAGRVVYEGHGGAGTTDNTVKFEFSRDYLKNSMRMRGEHYRFVFKAVLTEYPADGSLSVSNSAYAHVNNAGTYPSNSVETALVTPAWSVDKTADAYEYEVGDVIRFTSTFTQTERNAQCREVVFSDNLPRGMQLIPETLQARGLRSIPEAKVEGNRWSYSFDKFDYGDTLTVTYSAVALQSGNGIEQVNLAAAHANNCMDENDPAEVWGNSAKLSIEKSADYYEHRIGASDEDAGVVEYTVVVENTKEGTIANDVVIDDTSLPEGLRVARTNAGDIEVAVSGLPESVEYPCAGSDSVHGETETREVSAATTPRGTGFETSVNHLPANVPVTLTYRCYPEMKLAGWEVGNTATARAKNAAREQASALIWLNQPILRVEKTASLPSYDVGDFITYHLKVTNEAAGTLGRNLVISDLLRTKGVELQRDSIRIWDSAGNDITDSCTIRTNRNEPTFIAETHLPLVNSADERTVWSFGEQTVPGSNPLGAPGETAVYVDYTVAVADVELAGQTVSNTALAVVDEPNTKTVDETDVAVRGARLNLSKRSDSARYRVGDVARYELSVAQTRNGIAHDVVVEDAFEQRLPVAIDAGSIEVRNGQGDVVEPKSLATRENDAGDVVGFSLETGCDLAGDETLSVSYDAAMKGACEHVRNRAEAKAEDALGDTAMNVVAVAGPSADARIEKTANRSEARVGERVSFTIEATITESDAENVVLRDKSLPEGMPIDRNSVVVRVNGAPTEDARLSFAGNGFTAELGDLCEGDVVCATFDATVQDEALANTSVLNNAYLASPSIDGERMARAVVAVSPAKRTEPSASIAKDAGVESAREGDVIPYSIRVRDVVGRLEKAALADAGLPEGVVIDYATFVLTVDGSVKKPSFAQKDARSFVLDLGTLRPGCEIAVEYEATVEDATLIEGGIENSAILSSPSLDGDLSDTAEVAAIALPAAKTDAVLVKTVDNENPKEGDIVQFEITATAQGGEVVNATIGDTKMPEGAPIDFDSIRIAVNGESVERTISHEGNTFSIPLGTLAEGDVATIAFAAAIEDPALAGTMFSNRATLTSESLDDARIAHATLSVKAAADANGPEDPDDPAAPDNATSPQKTASKAGGVLGKTGDAVAGAIKAALALAALGAVGAGATVLARRRKARRGRIA